jgi:hypothetical protein
LTPSGACPHQEGDILFCNTISLHYAVIEEGIHV